MIREIPLSIDHNELLQSFNSLNLIGTMKNLSPTQLALQCRKETEISKQLHEGCGSLVYDWDDYDPEKDKELKKREVELNEEDFTETCDLFKGTYIEHVIEKLNSVYGVYRGRIMLMKHKTCLSMHTDETCRIHIPLITNPYCFMVIEDGIYKLPAGATYIAETTVTHTAVNSGRNDRIHLVFCTKMKY